MIPSAVTFVPTFAVTAYLGGVNTRWGIIAPGLFSAFSIFLFRQFYLRFPDGDRRSGAAGRPGLLRRLLAPAAAELHQSS